MSQCRHYTGTISLWFTVLGGRVSLLLSCEQGYDFTVNPVAQVFYVLLLRLLKEGVVRDSTKLHF